MNGGSGISIYGSSTNNKAILRNNLITGNLWGITAIYYHDIDMGTEDDWGYNEIHDNSNGGAIPGHRPGRPTVQYINRILKRVTLIGAFFLCIVAGVPMLVTVVSSILVDAGVSVPSGLGALTFSGSSLLIVVGVVLETIRDLEAQLSMRMSKGFLG